MAGERLGFFGTFLVRALFGVMIIFCVNQFLDFQGFEAAVGVNEVSFLTCGILGIPGIALLYGIILYGNL